MTQCLPTPSTTHQDPHPRQDHYRPHEIPESERHSLHDPQPDQRHRDIDRSIGGIDPARCSGMQRQQPGEERQQQRRRDQEQGRLSLPQPEVGQVATNNLSDCSEREQQNSTEHGRLWQTL